MKSNSPTSPVTTQRKKELVDWEDIGNGWSYHPIKDRYRLNSGEFEVTRDVVSNYMKDWGRKIERVHIIAVLNRLYRMSRGINY